MTDEEIAELERLAEQTKGRVDITSISDKPNVEYVMRAIEAVPKLIVALREARESEWRLREALTNLCDQLDAVAENPAYRSVWVVNQIHAGPYQGPNYVKELTDARVALAGVSDRGDTRK